MIFFLFLEGNLKSEGFILKIFYLALLWKFMIMWIYFKCVQFKTNVFILDGIFIRLWLISSSVDITRYEKYNPYIPGIKSTGNMVSQLVNRPLINQSEGLFQIDKCFQLTYTWSGPNCLSYSFIMTILFKEWGDCSRKLWKGVFLVFLIQLCNNEFKTSSVAKGAI